MNRIRVRRRRRGVRIKPALPLANSDVAQLDRASRKSFLEKKDSRAVRVKSRLNVPDLRQNIVDKNGERSLLLIALDGHMESVLPSRVQQRGGAEISQRAQRVGCLLYTSRCV